MRTNLVILLTFLFVFPIDISASDKVLTGVEKTNKILNEADKVVGRRDHNTSPSPTNEELNVQTSPALPVPITPCFRHPLIDPFICVSAYPTPIEIADIRYVENDWSKLGLKGHVKHITEIFLNENGDYVLKPISYIFQKNGMLNSIDTSDKTYQFIYQNNKLTKIILYDKKKGTSSEYTSPFTDSLHYNEQGQLVKSTSGIATTYSYDDQGACSKIIYNEEYPESIAAVTSTFTRNSYGDICSVYTESIFYEQIMDSEGYFTKGKKEDTTRETYTVEYQYDDQGNWISMQSEKCGAGWQVHLKRVIEYYDRSIPTKNPLTR